MVCAYSLFSLQSATSHSQALCSAITFWGATMISRYWEHERSNLYRGNTILGFIFATWPEPFDEWQSEQVTRHKVRVRGIEEGGVRNWQGTWGEKEPHGPESFGAQKWWRPRVSCTSGSFGDYFEACIPWDYDYIIRLQGKILIIFFCWSAMNAN